MALQLPSHGLDRLPKPEQQAYLRRMRDLLDVPDVPTSRQLVAYMETFNRSFRHPIFVGGGWRGGKTNFLCNLAIHLCKWIPRNRVVMCRKEFSTFRYSTLQELEEVLERVPEARHSPGNHEVHFPNGSEIWYMGIGTAVQREKLGSMQVGAFLVDEAPENQVDTIRMVMGRVRWTPAADANRLLVVFTGNPYPGWCKEWFITDPRARKRGYTYVEMLMADNPHGYQGYQADIEATMPEEWVQAFVHGNWDAMVPTMLVIPEGLLTACKRTRRVPNDADCVLGIDVGRSGGDQTVIARRRGDVFDIVDHWRFKRIDHSAEGIKAHVLAMRPLPRRICIDIDGLGAGVHDILAGWQDVGEFPLTIEIVGVNAEGRTQVELPDDNTKYGNRKAANAFLFRRKLEHGTADLSDLPDTAIADLAAARYQIGGGVIKIENKEMVKKQLGRSPDEGDAILLTMDEDAAPEEFDVDERTATRLAQQADGIDDDLDAMLREDEERQRRTSHWRQQFGMDPWGQDEDPYGVGY